MKPVSIALAAYGVFLILVGLAGYLSNPEKAKTALMSGGTFGLLNLGLAWLALKSWRPALPTGIGVACFLAVVFIWRASVSWMAVAGGASEKALAASLISTMLAASIAVIVYLSRHLRHSPKNSASPPAAQA